MGVLRCSPLLGLEVLSSGGAPPYAHSQTVAGGPWMSRFRCRSLYLARGLQRDEARGYWCCAGCEECGVTVGVPAVAAPRVSETLGHC
ncbi:hypothetical protein EPI10_030824 [Gossypium australe]|uniref:Uncharacterized protein n=1 Tax=Gossypium australe TaxID=47621 RepID=A0A5B6WZW8_9ROSI|nr:hypothetical protein EPI10_030824 [Gossypium australe]